MRKALWIILAVLFVAIGAPIAQADPAPGDILWQFTISNVTLTGNNTCTPSPCTETFNGSFEWDATQSALVPNTTSLTASGDLGISFTFFSAFEVGPPVFTPALVVEWVDAQGDGLAFDTFLSQITPPTTFPLQNDFSLACGGGVTDACASEGFNINGFQDTFTGGTVSVAFGSVPEPSTFLLLGVGLLVVALAAVSPAAVLGKPARRFLGKPLPLAVIPSKARDLLLAFSVGGGSF